MPSTSFSDGALRVRTPGSYDAHRAPVVAGRALPGEPGYEAAVAKDVLLETLRESGFERVESVDLTPRRERGIDGIPTPNRTDTVTIELDVPPDADAVVLLERDGVYSWHLPVDRERRTRDLEPGPHTARFELDVRPRPTRRPARRAPARRRRTRGLLGDLVQGAAQAIIFRFAAPLVVDRAIELMEQHVRPGLVRIASADVTAWTRFEALSELGLPTDRPVRILLFVHGTFSSTAGGFGALGVTESGRRFLAAAIEAYDAVVGFDHLTLSVDPRANAVDLLARLSTHHPEVTLTIDVITHSRGGLTTRSFVEYVLPQSDWDAVVDRVVFVAATNAGTHLAHPDRWSDLVDLYTNLATATARALSVLPGSAPVATIVGGVVRGIGAFVKYLVAYAAGKDGVPGLAAMVPDAEFVTELNRTQPGQPGPGTHWYVVSSNFHVELSDDHHSPPEFPRELVARLSEGFVDQIFEADNDLVVDTASMSAIGLPDGGFVADSLEFGTNETVYHGNYFGQDEVGRQLARWLLPAGLARGRGLEDLAMSAPPEPAREGLAEAHLAAEMPGRLPVRAAFTVRVRLSRRAIGATPGAAHREDVLHVDVARPLTVRVVGKRNAKVVGPDSDIFTLPAGGGTSELAFTLEAPRRGPVVVTVVVTQGTVPLSTISLESEAGTEQSAIAAPAMASVGSEAALGLDAPELEQLPCLQIFEVERDGKVLYEYAVRLRPGGEVRRFTSPPLKDRAKFVGGILAQVEDAWIDSGDRPKAFLSRVQDVGASLFEQVFPPEMQEFLWAHRDDLDQLLVYTDEPYLPWELVHLKPAVGPRQEPPRFLAQQGIVRWQFTGFPPRRLRVREGQARSLVPNYLDPAFHLTEPALEEEYLLEHFGAERVTATPTGVARLLRSGKFDLLHFSGHGVADPEDILDAKVLLAGRRRDGHVVPQYLSATTVSENARWARRGEAGPIIVLNACQVGRGGEQLSTAGGFAKAFLEAGASAFISCLWSVQEEPSRIFVEELYEQLQQGTPIAPASRRAREKAREAGDATWLSYVVYARPDAVLERS
ncbi:MAG TPA: CHAT domain-containing protein [Dermatophilaceae bacterium]|nr:CHAT domain-containing protein [Dermatophilaceae bacterium]